MNGNQTINAAKWCDELSFNHFHATVLIICALILLFDGYASTVIFFLIPHFMREWRLTPLQAGSAQSATFAGMLVGSLLFGMLGDVIGRKKGLLIAVLTFSLGTGFTYWVPNISSLCALRFFAGLGMGGVAPLIIALMSEFSPAKVRAKALSVTSIGFNLGPIIGSILAMVVISRYTWRALFLVEFLALLLVPAIVLYLPESVRFLTQKGRNEAAIRELRRLERVSGSTPVDWTPASLVVPVSAKIGIGKIFRSNLGVMTVLLWGAYFFTMLAFFGVQTWLPSLLMKTGHSMVKSYSFSLVMPVGGMIGFLFTGAIMDRFGRKKTLFPAMALAGVLTWLFGIYTSDAGLYVIGFFIGLVAGGCAMIGLNVVAGEIYPTRFRSTGVGWALTIAKLGSMFGPLLGGALQMAGLDFGKFFIVFAVPFIISAVIVALFRVNVRRESLETVTEELTAPG